MGDSSQVIFATYALASQAVLLAYFASRRWALPVAERYGWLAYAFGLLGIPVGVALIANGATPQLVGGPFLFAAWAAFGLWVDILRAIEWRNPIRWSVLAPYVLIYLAGQMFLWWPMWNFWRLGWAIYLVLFAANTALNIRGHFGPQARPAASS